MTAAVLLEAARSGLTPLARALLTLDPPFPAWRALTARRDWPVLARRLLDEAKVDDFRKKHGRDELRLLETMLGVLASGSDADITRLERISRGHPTLGSAATHALFGAGDRGLDLVAGPVGARVTARDRLAWLRCGAAIVRGDPPETVWSTDPRKRAAVLKALTIGLGRMKLARPIPSPKLLSGRGPWLGYVVEASRHPALRVSAEAILVQIPAARWKPLLAAQRGTSKAKPTAKARTRAKTKPTAKAKTAVGRR